MAQRDVCVCMFASVYVCVEEGCSPERVGATGHFGNVVCLWGEKVDGGIKTVRGLVK